MQEDNEVLCCPRVLVRSWGDESVSLFLHRIENNRLFVGEAKARTPIGLPLDQVFAFEPDGFAQLCTAYEVVDKRKLSELLAKIPVDDFACNKYKINVESSRDQEHVANTERAPSRNAE